MNEHILIIDDDKKLVARYKEVLDKAGYECKLSSLWYSQYLCEDCVKELKTKYPNFAKGG